MAETTLEVRAPSAGERESLYAWLNAGLRGGRPRRLEREFPTVAEGRDLDGHVLALDDGVFAAHALAHRAWLRAGCHRISVGMIGMVYTDPSKRHRGLARRCIEEATGRIRRGGAGLCMLWSELDGFYQRLGFVRGGQEWFFWLGRHELDAWVNAAADGELCVAAPGEADWPAMEALYERHASRVERPAGALSRLAASPECVVRVARRGTRTVAYAACGRGDDFPDIVHEWAGEPGAVLSCLEDLCDGRDWLGLLCPPSARAMMATLRAAEFRHFPNDLAWFRVVDAELLWEQLGANAPALQALAVRGSGRRIRCAGAKGETQLEAAAFLDWILKGATPSGLEASLPAPALAAIGAELPVPLYLWGFDSV